MAENVSTPVGVKYDADKPMYSLLPPRSLEETAIILTFGAKKYAPNNWMFVENSEQRYFDAMQRHLWAWKRGERLDSESGRNHLAHAMCCLMFLLEKDTYTPHQWEEHIKKFKVEKE